MRRLNSFFMKMRIWGRVIFEGKKNLKTNRCLGLIFDGENKRVFDKEWIWHKFK